MVFWIEDKDESMNSIGFPLMISFGVGVMIVLQGGVNQKSIPNLTLPGAVFLNAGIFFLISSVILYQTKTSLNVFQSMKSWYLIPGLCGAGIVFGVPMAISKWGSLNTFLVMVMSQLLISPVWDYFMNGIKPTPQRLIGIFLAIVGTFLTTLRKS